MSITTVASDAYGTHFDSSGAARLDILSNGTRAMLASAIGSADIVGSPVAVLSVEEVGVHKPRRSANDLVASGPGGAPERMLFVSSIGWDIAGAGRYGFAALWTNRSGRPEDRRPRILTHTANKPTAPLSLPGP